MTYRSTVKCARMEIKPMPLSFGLKHSEDGQHIIRRHKRR